MAAAFYSILEGLMTYADPVAPNFPATPIGDLTGQAWEEQQALGWINVAKGRLCKSWGKAQGQFYSMHPDLQGKRWCSATLWTQPMIKALVNMSLQMFET